MLFWILQAPGRRGLGHLEALIDEGEDDPRGLYKALSPEGNPTLVTVVKVAHALGLRLRFEAIA